MPLYSSVARFSADNGYTGIWTDNGGALLGWLAQLLSMYTLKHLQLIAKIGQRKHQKAWKQEIW